MAGLSISIIIGQLDGLLGTEVDGNSAVAELVDLLGNIDAWDALTAAMGVSAVVVLLRLETVRPQSARVTTGGRRRDRAGRRARPG